MNSAFETMMWGRSNMTHRPGGTAMTVGCSAGSTVWNIQILRFVAAAMVLFGHLNHEVMRRPEMQSAGFRPFEAVWWPGGVDIFFVISGFIMYHIFAGQFGVPGAPRRFIERRIIRLVPPYWAFTRLVLVAIALFPVQMTANSTSLWHIVSSLLFITSENPSGVAMPVLVDGWTLNFEMLFYRCFALALLAAERWGVAVVTAILLALAIGVMFGPDPLPFGFWCNSIVIEFLFGMGVAAARRNGLRVSNGVGLTLSAAGILLLLAMQIMGISGVDHVWRFLWAGVPALLLCAGAAWVQEPAVPGQLRRTFIFGGDISFAIYLSHPFALTILGFVTSYAGVRDPWIYIAISFTMCLLAAALVFIWFERPVYRWMTRIHEKQRINECAPPL